MIKKAKRKSIKTGHRTADEPRCTTISVGYVDYTTTRDSHSKNLPEVDPLEEESKPRLTKGERKRLERLKREEQLALYNEENNTRFVYPHDVWYLIGRFVTPECVKKFSSICVGAYKVTCSRNFWIELYKRFVTDHSGLPSHLKPYAINSNVGLKTRVIRSLFFSYKPLAGDRSQRVPLADIPNELTIKDRMVESHWWKKLVSVKNHIQVWRLHFKFVTVSKTRKRHGMNLLACTDEEDLIHYNPEEKNSMLQVTSPAYTNLPNNVFGMCLTNISVGLSRNLKNHKVKLFFHEYRPLGRYVDSQATVLVLDPVFDVQFLNWWDPEYPHPFDR